jgi:riboflavin kinase/FMN adenylyltransferase
MLRYDSIHGIGSALAGAVVTIGNFDGLHLGHRRLVERTLATARDRGVAAAALTFRPHPTRILAPAMAPPLITTAEQRRALFAETGLDALIEQPFNADFAGLAPEAFAALVLDQLGARGIVVGHDFTYGRARGGNVESLRAACEARGATLEIVPPVTVDGLVASSTKVREFVLGGNVEGAASLLGRLFELVGPVVKGAGRGRTIGVPTANVAAENELVPGIGVYAVRVTLPDGSIAPGACNVGLNPTFRPENEGPGVRALSVEVHLLDRQLDLYGQRLTLSFVTRLRAERRFPSVDALVAQIRTDLDEARRILS